MADGYSLHQNQYTEASGCRFSPPLQYAGRKGLKEASKFTLDPKILLNWLKGKIRSQILLPCPAPIQSSLQKQPQAAFFASDDSAILVGCTLWESVYMCTIHRGTLLGGCGWRPQSKKKTKGLGANISLRRVGSLIYLVFSKEKTNSMQLTQFPSGYNSVHENLL